MTPLISIVSAVQDHDCFEHWVKALANQTGLTRSAYEIVITDGSGLQDWSPMARRVGQQAGADFNFRFVPLAKCGRAAATNHAIGLTTAPLLLFIADDFVPQPHVVAQHLNYHRKKPDATCGALGPGVFNDDQLTPFMRWLENSGTLFGTNFKAPNPQLPPSFWYLGNSSVKRSLIDRVGPFDERFPYDAWDDYEMGLRLFAAGLKVDLLPDAVCIHQHSVSLRERQRAMRHAGESASIFENSHLGPQPWHRTLSDPDEYLLPQGRLETARLWLKQWLEPTEENRESFYRRALDTAFTQGYHGAAYSSCNTPSV